MEEKKLIIAINAAEARLFRTQGYQVVTSAKLRSQLARLLQLEARSAFAENAAAEAIGRFDGISSADNPQKWALWDHTQLPTAIKAAFANLPVIETPLKSPTTVLYQHGRWAAIGTTIFVAEDTLQLVRVADTYADANIYRPTGRMDEPFRPIPNKSCLITQDELRMLRLDEGLCTTAPFISIVFTYAPQMMTGMGATQRYPASRLNGAAQERDVGLQEVNGDNYHWPTAYKAIIAEHGSYVATGIAPRLVAARRGRPFFVGLSRGVGYDAVAVTDTQTQAAKEFVIQTNQTAQRVQINVVAWEGGNDPSQLLRFGGLTIYTGKGKHGAGRRKVQLRSLGLEPAAEVAGVRVYNFADANLAKIEAWTTKREYAKCKVSKRTKNRIRNPNPPCKIRRPEKSQGDVYIYISPPGTIEVSNAKRRQKAALKLRKSLIAKELTPKLYGNNEGESNGGVAIVSLIDIGGTIGEIIEGGEARYYLNGRAKPDAKTGGCSISRIRHRVRCAVWASGDPEGMVEELKNDPYVVMCGLTQDEDVFGVVRVLNGTEDQQAEAVNKWAEQYSTKYISPIGTTSLVPGCLETGYAVDVATVFYRNFDADGLQTECFERYQTFGDYEKPLRIAGNGATTASRTEAYLDRVNLQNDGTRNSRLASVMLNILRLFGSPALSEAMPSILRRCTLPQKEIMSMYYRVISRKYTEADGKIDR